MCLDLDNADPIVTIEIADKMNNNAKCFFVLKKSFVGKMYLFKVNNISSSNKKIRK